MAFVRCGRIFVVFSLAVFCCVALPKIARGADRPNVLFLAIDDLNDWTGGLGGHECVKTPHLDRLASRGVLFRRAYCTAPACNPSRASLLTGVLPSTSGVYHNSQPFRPVMPDAVTLPQHFIAAGYHVVGGGKIFHGSFPDKQSWQEYFSKGSQPKPAVIPANGIAKDRFFDWGPVDVPDEDMADMHTVQWAIDYLGESHAKPFFLAVGLHKPHLPWYVPRKYFERYPLSKVTLPKVIPNDLDDVPAAGVRMANPEGDHKNVVEHGQWEKAVQGYLATISFADACVGRLLDALDHSQYGRNTIIVMWSDHGWNLGEKEHWRKFALWEDTTRVPMVFVVPGMTKTDQRCDRTVSLLDIYPTLVELCGLPARKNLEGASIVPLLKDVSAKWDRPVVTTRGRNNHGIRSERWRYIRYEDGGEELYDHTNDPHEWTNLANKPEYAEIKRGLAKWLPKRNAPDAPANRKGWERGVDRIPPADK